MAGAVVAEFAIYLVYYEKHVVSCRHTAQLAYLLFAVEIPGGVVGIAYKYGARTVGHGPFHLRYGREGEIVVYGRPYGDYLDSGLYGESVIVGVERFGDEHLVARVEARHESEDYSFRSSGGDQNILVGDGRDA